MNKVESLLSSQGIEYKAVVRSSGHQAIATCPFCHGDGKDKDTFAINLETGAWNCMRGKCGKHGSWYDLSSELGLQYKPLEEQFYSKPKVNYSKPQISFNPLPDEAKKYMIETRKLSKEVLKKYSVTAQGDRIAFPYFKDGELINVKYRSKGDGNWKKMSQEKSCRPTLYGSDLINKDHDRLIITEGEFDALALAQYGLENVVSIPGGTNNNKWIDEEWDWLEFFNTIYLVMDNDEAGLMATKDFTRRLGIWRCVIVDLPMKDANECLIQGVDRAKILECFQVAKKVEHEKLSHISAYIDEVIDLVENPDRLNGTKTGMTQLDWLLKGWRDGEVTIWTGQNGAGKSTLLGQMLLNLADKKVFSCVASMELKPKRYLHWQALQITDCGNARDIRKSLEWLQDYQYIADVTGDILLNELLDIFTYAARRYGVKHFVVDSLMKIKLNNVDKYEAQKDCVNRLTEFAKKYNCHVHLVAHPRKSESDTAEPGKMDVAGSSDITNLADNVIILTRNMKDDFKGGGLILKKNREHGFLGKFALEFNEISKRFTSEGDTINYNYKGATDEWTK
jgi:twinkle protein